MLSLSWGIKRWSLFGTGFMDIPKSVKIVFAVTGPMYVLLVSKSSEESVHRVYGKHCSYRQSNFYDLITLLNVFYRVTPFKQAQTRMEAL